MVIFHSYVSLPEGTRLKGLKGQVGLRSGRGCNFFLQDYKLPTWKSAATPEPFSIL